MVRKKRAESACQNMKRLIILIAALLLAASVVFSQGSQPINPGNPLPDWVRRIDEKRRAMDRTNGRTPGGMIADRPDPRIAVTHGTKPDGKPYTREEIEQLKELLKPDEKDSAKYAAFLKQSKTGLFRLFRFQDCETKNLIRVDGECRDYIPNSGLYSFRAKNYSETAFFDLKWRDEILVSGSTLSLGILTSLGDVPVEQISLASDGMKFLADLKPATEQAECVKQMAQFVQGLESGGYAYASRIKIEENKTYGLRVVAYRMPNGVKLELVSEDVRRFPYGDSYPLNTADIRDDVVIAFRIVRRSADNVSILWKELRRTDAPKMVFPKDVKIVTVKPKSD
jgi:hypothetical protein